MLISFYLFVLYILWTVGVIPFKVLPTLINVDVDVDRIGLTLPSLACLTKLLTE